MNIMTSCDDRLMKYIWPQLEAIHENMPDEKVDFYLFHGVADEAPLRELEKLCEAYDNIAFHDVFIRDEEGYDVLARLGGKWPAAAYYSFCAHLVLPELDRILYLDAGDTLVLKCPHEYYYGDFEGKALKVTSCVGDENGAVRVYGEDELFDLSKLPRILRGTFNSGSYVLNLSKMREIGFSMDDYIALSRALSDALGLESEVYFGDQGLLSAAYIGNMNIYGIERKDVWYMPNDLCTPYFFEKNGEPDYDFNIIHFSTSQKPWKIDVPKGFDFERDSAGLNMSVGMSAFFKYVCLWHKYNEIAKARVL